MLVKDHLDGPATFFRDIAILLHDRLDGSEAVGVALSYMPEEKRADFLENFTDAIMYERIGNYLLKSLVSIYDSQELAFKRKCLAIYEISRSDRKHFNEVFHCELPAQLVPTKSHRILKVLQRC